MDVVAVTRIDRLSRNVRDFGMLLGQLVRRGVRLVLPDGPVDVPLVLRLLRETQKRRLNRC